MVQAERRTGRKRGGQPGHQGKGLQRDPDPDEKKDAEPPAECRGCGAGLGGAEAAGSRWAQLIDVKIIPVVTEWALPGLSCLCCGTVTFAAPPPGAHPGAMSYGPVLNAAAVLLSCYGNVPPERAAQVMGMLLGVPVPAGWAGKAAARISGQLGKAAAGAPHLLITRTPDGRLTFLQAIGSRRKGSVAAAVPAGFAGYLITDGYTGYQHLLSRLAGIQQCAQHVRRRCRAVTKLGPCGAQNWAGDVITVLRHAHEAVEAARARGDTALDQQALDDLRERYDTAVKSRMIHNRLRDWHNGNHPGYSLGTWLRDYKEQVFLFTREFAVSWTNNVSERGGKAAKRHQAASGYWHSLATLARWRRLRSYLDATAANGITTLDAIARSPARAASKSTTWPGSKNARSLSLTLSRNAGTSVTAFQTQSPPREPGQRHRGRPAPDPRRHSSR